MTEATKNKLEEQLRLAKAWGFDYICVQMPLGEAEEVLRLSRYHPEEITHQRAS
jgi:hypothetical protein